MSDFLCLGYEGMSDAIRNHKGKRVFTPEQIRRRFSKEMMECGVIFKMQIARGQRQNVCAWFSQLQRFFELRGRLYEDSPTVSIDSPLENGNHHAPTE